MKYSKFFPILIFTLPLIYEGIIQLIERVDRVRAWRLAEDIANRLNKPILIVSRPKGRHPCGSKVRGDVCIDVDPKVLRECPETGMVLSVYDVDKVFKEKQFAVAYVSHVLEHLEYPHIALKKLLKVADHVVIVAPRKLSIAAILHPEHKWWVHVKDNTVIFEGRDYPVKIIVTYS